MFKMKIVLDCMCFFQRVKFRFSPLRAMTARPRLPAYKTDSYLQNEFHLTRNSTAFLPKQICPCLFEQDHSSHQSDPHSVKEASDVELGCG